MKTALVTGASSGIGRATALELARRGFHVIAAGRSRTRAQPVLQEIDGEGGTAEFLYVDLASLQASREAGMAFEDSGRTLDVLVNNAGVGGVRGRTHDGFELHFGVNHLGHFMLTHHLRRTFVPGTRIVVVTSEAHQHARGIDWDRVTRKTGLLRGFSDYGVSKLANILFARKLGALQPDWRTYSVHPGVTDTNIYPAIARPFFRNRQTPAEGAETVVWCATEPTLGTDSGRYYAKKTARDPSVYALDDDLADELWRRSELWCGVAPQHG